MDNLIPPWAVHITAVLPAHNEAATVGDTIRSLQAQTRRPDQILVVSDNSTDDTVGVARAAGAEVMETAGNTARKAGALNQALEYLAPTLGPRDLVLVMDADTVMVPTWIERALTELDDPAVGAVGAVFQADTDKGWLRGCCAVDACRDPRAPRPEPGEPVTPPKRSTNWENRAADVNREINAWKQYEQDQTTAANMRRLLKEKNQ